MFLTRDSSKVSDFPFTDNTNRVKAYRRTIQPQRSWRPPSFLSSVPGLSLPTEAMISLLLLLLFYFRPSSSIVRTYLSSLNYFLPSCMTSFISASCLSLHLPFFSIDILSLSLSFPFLLSLTLFTPVSCFLLDLFTYLLLYPYLFSLHFFVFPSSAKLIIVGAL